MNKKKLYLNLEWNDALYEACKHLSYPEEIIRSVISNDNLKAFEAKGGNEDIYRVIKGAVDDYCYLVIEHCRKKTAMILDNA